MTNKETELFASINQAKAILAEELLDDGTKIEHAYCVLHNATKEPTHDK